MATKFEKIVDGITFECELTEGNRFLVTQKGTNYRGKLQTAEEVERFMKLRAREINMRKGQLAEKGWKPEYSNQQTSTFDLTAM